MKEFDLAIIGAGVTGAAAAREFSRYRLKCALLEKASDIGFGVSKANSGIIHGGFHYSKTQTLKGKLEIAGNLKFDELQRELGFPFRRCGIIVTAFDDEQLAGAKKLYERGLENGVPGIEFCSAERMYELEPKLAEGVCGGLFAPGGGVIEPYRYVFALGDAAKRNGVDVICNYKVVHAVFFNEAWTVFPEDGDPIRARYVINAAGLYADDVSVIFGGESYTISPRKGEEYLLDRTSSAYPSRVVFPMPSKTSKGILVIPTAEGTTMIGPTADSVDDKEERFTTAENMDKIFDLAGKLVKGVSRRDLITSFSGSRPAIEPGNDFFIAVSKTTPNFIQAGGIQSPGLTASPAVAVYLTELARSAGLKLVLKDSLPADPPHSRQIRNMTAEEADHLHSQDPAWTNIICRCEHISEAEIVEAIRRGHTTLDGIKFFCRAGMGRCQGGFCSNKIFELIARETGTPLEEITRRGGKSYLMNGKIGDIKRLNLYGTEAHHA